MGSRNPLSFLGAALVALSFVGGAALAGEEPGEETLPAGGLPDSEGGPISPAPVAVARADIPLADSPRSLLRGPPLREVEGEDLGNDGAPPERALDLRRGPETGDSRALLSLTEPTSRSRQLDADSLYRVALSRWRAGEKAFALRCFEEIEARAASGGDVDPSALAGALRLIGQHRLDGGRYSEAEELFRKSLLKATSGEDGCAAAQGIVLSLRRQGRIDEAVTAMEEHLGSHADPRCAERSLFMLGYLECERGDRERADMRFRDCAARYPEGIHGLRARRRLESEPDPARARASTERTRTAGAHAASPAGG